MSIRQARPSDSPQISKLISSLSHYYLDDPEQTLPRWLAETLSDEAVISRLSNTDYLHLVYEQQESIVAYISVKKPNHLYHLFVSESYQGQGISRLLWEAMLKHLPQTEFTVRSSLYAVPIYKRFGFRESGPSGTKEGVSFQPMILKLITRR